MGLFKKNKSLEEILEIKNNDQLIKELYSYLDKKCYYGDYLGELSEDELIIYLILNFESQLAEGGFEYYFTSLYGNYVLDVKEAFKEVGEERIVEVIDQAIDYFPDEFDFSDQLEREKYMDLLMVDHPEGFNDVDETYYNLEVNIKEIVLKLIEKLKA